VVQNISWWRYEATGFQPPTFLEAFKESVHIRVHLWLKTGTGVGDFF
jgi:hypothetical protein